MKISVICDCIVLYDVGFLQILIVNPLPLLSDRVSLLLLIYLLWFVLSLCPYNFVFVACFSSLFSCVAVFVSFCLSLLPPPIPQPATRRSTKVSLNTATKHSGNVWSNLWLCLQFNNTTLLVIFLLNVAVHSLFYFCMQYLKCLQDVPKYTAYTVVQHCIPQCSVPNQKKTWK